MARKRTMTLFKSLSRDREGAVAVIAALFLFVLLGMGALAIDMSYAYKTRSLLQATASAAALAAAPKLGDLSQARARAQEYVEDNMPADEHGTVLDNSDVVVGNWDPDTRTWTPGGTPANALQVTARRSAANDNQLNLFLAPVLGLASLDMEASAVAYFKSPTAWDVVLVQDVTGSFSEEIDDAKIADQALLDCISNNLVNTKMGLTAFTGYGHIMTPMLPVGSGDPLSQPNYESMSDAITNLNSCGRPADPAMPPCTGTHIGVGIESATEQLDSYEPDVGIVGQSMIIVGDGAPNASAAAQSSYRASPHYSCGSSCSDNELRDMAIAAADAAYAKGYNIYAIFYDEANDDDASAFFESLVRGTGIYRRTPNSDELDELMFDLCANLTGLELVN